MKYQNLWLLKTRSVWHVDRKEQESLQKDKAALQVQESKHLKSLTDAQDR